MCGSMTERRVCVRKECVRGCVCGGCMTERGGCVCGSMTERRVCVWKYDREEGVCVEI